MMRTTHITKFGFDIVHGCQLRCLGCPNSTLKPKIKQISPDDFNRCLQNVDIQSVDIFRLFNFGEPLLHDDLPAILSQLEKQNWKANIVEISTNAQYHDYHMLAESLKTGKITRLCVSCDGDGTAQDYERLRPPGKWEKLVKFLQQAKILRDRHAPDTQLITRVVCSDEIAQERWNTLLQPLGWKPEFRDWLYLPGGSNMTGREPPKRSGVCSFLSLPTLYVDCDGTVVPCCVHPRAGVLGNLKYQKLSEIYLGPERIHRLNEMKTNRKSLEICNECDF